MAPELGSSRVPSIKMTLVILVLQKTLPMLASVDRSYKLKNRSNPTQASIPLDDVRLYTSTARMLPVGRLFPERSPKWPLMHFFEREKDITLPWESATITSLEISGTLWGEKDLSSRPRTIETRGEVPTSTFNMGLRDSSVLYTRTCSYVREQSADNKPDEIACNRQSNTHHLVDYIVHPENRDLRSIRAVSD